MTYSAKASAPVSGKERVVLDSGDDDDEAGPMPGNPGSTAAGGGSPQASDSAVKKRKLNRHGLITLTNAVQRSSFLEGAGTFRSCTIERR